MPGLIQKRSRSSELKKQGFHFEEAIATQTLRTAFSAEIPRGRVLPKDHDLVRRFPEHFRLLGPRPDQYEEGVSHDGEEL
jgi:hypothetical protein